MPTKNIIYREATANDIPFMKQMLIESCIASGVTSITIENLHEHPDTEINIEGWSCEDEPGVIAQDQSGESIGGAWLRNLPELGHSVGEYLPEITIAVLPTERKNGVATALMNLLYHKCVEKGITHISLGVHSKNLPAINLYKKEGWQQDGTFQDYIMMSKRLTSPHTKSVNPAVDLA